MARRFPSPIPLLPKVEVEWVDAASHTGWERPEDFRDTLAVIRTTGYLVRVTPHKVMLAMSQGVGMNPRNEFTGYCGGYWSIPRVLITWPERFKIRRRRRKK